MYGTTANDGVPAIPTIKAGYISFEESVNKNFNEFNRNLYTLEYLHNGSLSNSVVLTIITSFTSGVGISTPLFYANKLKHNKYSVSKMIK